MLQTTQNTEKILSYLVNNKPTLVIGIVAGEISGDTLGADFMRQMNALHNDILWVGVGGSQMQAQGLMSVIDMARLSVMGLVEVLAHLPDLLKARDEILQAFDNYKIDMFMGIDAPDFNLRLGKRLKSKQIYCIQYVSPSIWAWREGRIKKIKQATHLVLCLFPFELPVYKKHHHPAVCVGHSLLKTLDTGLLETPILDLRRELMWQNSRLQQFFSQSLQISHLITVMPGSRQGEIKAILPKMLATIEKLLDIDEALCFVIPTVNQNLFDSIMTYVEKLPNDVQQRIVVSFDDTVSDFSQCVMAMSDLVLLASGTATLEAMLLNRPMVVVYSMKPLTFWIAKWLVKTPYVALPNILAGREIVPELIQHDANPENISRKVIQVLTSGNYQQQLKDLQTTTTWLREQSSVRPAFAVIEGWQDFQENTQQKLLSQVADEK